MIPDEAVEAAAKASIAWAIHDLPDDDEIRAVLEAAAPHMMAAAWVEGLKLGIRLQSEFARDPLSNPGAIRNPYA